MKKRSFLLELPMQHGSQARNGFGALLAANRNDYPVSFEGKIMGTIAGLWRHDDRFCAALLLDAHDGWAPLAARKPALAFELELQMKQEEMTPLRVLTDKAVLPLLALDSAISRRWDGTSYRLESLFAFVGRWFAGPGAGLRRPDHAEASIGP